jgi:hypothetical protein
MNENEQTPDDTLPGVDPAKIRKLMDKLGINPQPAGSPALASPAADAHEPVNEEPAQAIDWSGFNLDPSIAHLYPHSKMQDTPEGPRFIAMIDVFEFETAQYRKLGKITTQRVNGDERWRIATVYGNGSGMGVVLFTRTIPMILPIPEKLKTEADLPTPPTDKELSEAEQKAINWIEKEGQVTEAETILVPLAVTASEDAVDALDGPDFGSGLGGGQDPYVDNPAVVD